MTIKAKMRLMGGWPAPLMCFLWLVLIALQGCDQAEPPAAEQARLQSTVPVWVNHPNQADLVKISESGVLRLLAPASDGESGLTRNGLSAGEYRRLAEKFAASLGLKVKWIYTEYFDQLLPQLEAGLGDVVITNLTVTDAREQRASFAQPIDNVDELLVYPARFKGKALGQLPQLQVQVPKGTSYQETLSEIAADYPQLVMETVDSNLSDFEMIELVAKGQIDATVIDSNIAEEFFKNLANPSSFGAAMGPIVKAKRKIAWAVRKTNPELLSALNHFLISERIEASVYQKEKRDWPQVKTQKLLRLITTNNAASYFIWRGELMGFDYDLVKKFANENDLRLQVIVYDSFADIRTALEQGEGDLIAAAMTATEERKAQGMVFSRPYLLVKEQLISHVDEGAVDSMQALRNRSIVVNPDKSYYHTLKAIQKQLRHSHDSLRKQLHVKTLKPAFEIVEMPGATTEELVEAVAKGMYDFTVVDSHLSAIESTYREDIKVQLDLTDERPIAFALRADQKVLKQKLDEFVKTQYRGLFYNVTYNKYFKNKKNILKNRKHRVEPGKPISPYDEIVKRLAEEYGYDWRLLTSQMYQESRFNPKAKSYAGARGLMQVLPRTAKQFGYIDLFEPQQGIEAGVVYFDWLRDRFPATLPLEEQIYFMLAAYNAGHGHVRDARRLAVQLGKDPNQWFGHVEHAMLLLAKPQYARKARFGYVRGIEPVNYVKSIRQRYLGYLSSHAK